LVIKKMVYLYLTNYARSHPELAQMCTNTLQKDCGNDDPMVRGLALRALAGLNLPQMLEYIVEPVRRSLTDGHGYVRKTAVMGCLKIYHMDREAFDEAGFVDVLYDMLRDADASVVANVVIVLNEVMQDSPAGGMAINRAIMLHLLNRIHEFNEFAKVQILELVPRYIPADEEEGFQIMNLLDPVLRTSDSGATSKTFPGLAPRCFPSPFRYAQNFVYFELLFSVATIKAFLSLAEHLGEEVEMKKQIVARIKAPIVTQISSGSSEIMYSLLKHVEVLTHICPGVFDDEYRQFYVRYNEPTHVKYLKIGILPKLSNPDTAPDIVSELAECVHDKNPKLGRLAIQAMGQIACSGRGGPGAAEAIARRLVDMLDSPAAHISSEAASALTLMVRKHPSLKEQIAPPLVRSLRYVTEASGKTAVIYLLGECGPIVREAPYALEKLIDNYDTIADVSIKTALLTSTVKLFFQRPPEVQRMLGRLLAKATDDVSSQDLHDRALLYYRMLRSGTTDFVSLESVVKTNAAVPDDANFSEEANDAFRAELMEEFNTLSILYGKPSVNFIAEEYRVRYVKMPEEHPLAPGVSSSDSVVAEQQHYQQQQQILQQQQQHHVPAPHEVEVDLLGFGGPSSSPVAASAASPPPPAPPLSSSHAVAGISLNPSVAMTGDEYQAKWGAIPDADATVSTVFLPRLPASTDAIEQALASAHVMTMASGELPNEFKFFLYCQDGASGSFFLIQSNIEKTAGEPLIILTIKKSGGSGGPDLIERLVEVINKALN
jgi:AP-4 complex subunit beta-1